MILRALRVWVLCLFAVGCGLTVQPQAPEVKAAASWAPEKLERDWDRLLKKYVSSGGVVDYQSIHDRPDELAAIYAQLAEFSPDSSPELFSSDEQRFAYWLNAYNIAVVRGVAEHYPIETVLEVKPPSPVSLIDKGGFFVGQRFVFGGAKHHLYKLENGVIRKRFSDPRLHFALNCASGGCPALPRESFQAGKLERQLERETLKFINSSRAYRIDEEKREIEVSQIFDWYREDFTLYLADQGDPEGTVLDYIERYLRGKRLTEFMKARRQGFVEGSLPYDWSLNDIRPKAAAP